MAPFRKLVVLVVFALVAAACSSAPADALSVEEYSARLAEILEGEEAPEDDFPVGGSSVRVAATYMVVEEAVAEFRSLVPPQELEALHAELVEQFQSVQETIGDYLQHHGVEGGEITLSDILFDPEIRPRFAAAHQKCQELRTELFDLDAPLPLNWCLV